MSHDLAVTSAMRMRESTGASDAPHETGVVMGRLARVSLMMVIGLFAGGMTGKANAEYPVTDTVRALETIELMLAAEDSSDQETLDVLLAPEHTRISASGDVETRSEVIASHGATAIPDARRLVGSEKAVLTEVAFEETAGGVIVIALLIKSRPSTGDVRDSPQRASFLLEKRDGRWTVLFAQYTPASREKA